MLGRGNLLNNERGSVLIIAVLMLVLLTIIGISATNTTTTDLQIAGNEKTHRIAFYAAESGIEAGRAVLNGLKNADSGNWDNLLAGNDLVGQPSGTTTLDAVLDSAGGRDVGLLNDSAPPQYNLQVRDNQDFDLSSTVDADNAIILISTGRYRNAEARIETLVRYTGGGDQYAQEHYDTDSSGKAALESRAVAGQVRW